MGKLGYVLVAVIVAVGLVFGFAGPSAAKPVKFKAVAFLPVNKVDVKGFRMFIDMVNKKFKNYINIDLIGGPEVTPPFQLHEAVRKGVIDMTQTSCCYYPSLLWEAQAGMFTNTTRQERYETDFHKTMTDLHAGVGLTWLGNSSFNQTFHLYTNKPVKKLADFKGLKIRVFPAFIPLMKTLGAVPINLPMGDIYTAMERGTVDGFVMTHFGFVTDFSWHEVTKYVIDYDLYQGTAYILANPKKWNKIPADVREQIKAFKKNVTNNEVAKFFANTSDERWKLMLSKGVKPLKFSPSGGKKFLEIAYEAAWDNVIKKSPELGPKLKKMLVK
ncbi:MAG: TRAP transporter substrate-binding protein DctP [Desulfatiglandales bacterium]|jgi:TRAP-type C4-dicarboxylate transport system substrate-binding protein|nr:TRAP transporter substrate-binding protein DctP [Desulfatiglandales bacterium]